MRLADRMTREPRPIDAEKGNDVAASIPDLPRALFGLVAGAAGSSPFLASLLTKEGAWLSAAVDAPEDALKDEIARVHRLPPEALADGLRQAKRRTALLVALADLGGAWSLQNVTEALTDLADAACQLALRAALLHQIRRGKLAGMTEDAVETGAGMVVFAMGKMGAAELNYSSDIDLICLFDETRFDPADYAVARSGFARATRAMAAMLGEMTAQGYVFRTDLRLRPDPAVTPVCIAMEAAEQYYESLGRTWERAAYIKARPAAGDLEAGARFLDSLRPFVWRRHLDFAAIQDAHDMRLAIREHKGLSGPITLAGNNMKLGRGGIREIEFFTQTRQLIAGGRDPDLRCRGTVPGLEALKRKGWIGAEVADVLAAHYVAHRTVEHRLQMVQDAQTHSLPRTEPEFARIAALMDLEVDALKADVRERLEEVHSLTEDFFAPDASSHKTSTADVDESVLNRWLSYPALRSTRARRIFDRLKPDLLSRLAEATRPQEALQAFDGFLAGLPTGVQFFSLLEANPQLCDLIIDITGTSPALAQYLAQNAGVFDAVIGGDFFADWPGQDDLQKALRPLLAAETDYERKLDALRRWHKEWNFRIGVHLLRGLIGAHEANRQYTDLARAVVHVLWPEVVSEFARKFGTPPGRGAVVLGMGSLGGGTLSAGSDLDLIVIYDPLEEEASNGKKSLPTRVYFARLTQSLITALSAPMAEGKLFEVDMRLRPSGNQGPVATSWSAFRNYQHEQAWVWEHLALTRAVVVAGPEDLAHDVESFLSALLTAPRDRAPVLGEVARMRARLQEARAAAGLWDVRAGPGGLQQIELFAQAAALLGEAPEAQTQAALQLSAEIGVLGPKDAEVLASAADLQRRVHVALRLLSPQPPSDGIPGLAAQSFVARVAGREPIETLEADLAQSYQDAASILDAALSPYETASD